MAKLTASARKHLSSGSFALPNALARVSQHGTPAEKAKVRAAVHHKYPSISKVDGKFARKK